MKQTIRIITIQILSTMSLLYGIGVSIRCDIKSVVNIKYNVIQTM